MATFSSTGTTKKKATPRPMSLSQILASAFSGQKTSAFGQRPTGPAAAQAFDATYARFQPVFDALAAQYHGNATQYSQARKANEFSGLAGAQGIDTIRQNYMSAAAPLASVAADAGPEQQRAAGQLGLTSNAVGGMLATLAANQRQGIVSQNEAARNDYLGKQASMAQQIQSSLGQAGAYYGQTRGDVAGDIRNARLKAAQQQATNAYHQATLDSAMIRDGRNPTTGLPDPRLADPVKPSKPGSQWNSKDKLDTFRKAVGLATNYGKTLAAGKLNGAQIVNALVSGTPSSPIYATQKDPATGRDKRVRTGSTPSMPAIADTLAAKAGAEVALYGGISSKTAQKLHNARYTVRDLGVPVIPQARFDQMVRERYHPRPTSRTTAKRAAKNFGLG